MSGSSSLYSIKISDTADSSVYDFGGTFSLVPDIAHTDNISIADTIATATIEWKTVRTANDGLSATSSVATSIQTIASYSTTDTVGITDVTTDSIENWIHAHSNSDNIGFTETVTDDTTDWIHIRTVGEAIGTSDNVVTLTTQIVSKTITDSIGFMDSIAEETDRWKYNYSANDSVAFSEDITSLTDEWLIEVPTVTEAVSILDETTYSINTFLIERTISESISTQDTFSSAGETYYTPVQYSESSGDSFGISDTVKYIVHQELPALQFAQENNAYGNVIFYGGRTLPNKMGEYNNSQIYGEAISGHVKVADLGSPTMEYEVTIKGVNETKKNQCVNFFNDSTVNFGEHTFTMIDENNTIHSDMRLHSLKGFDFPARPGGYYELKMKIRKGK